MVQLTIVHPTSPTSSCLQPGLIFTFKMDVSLNPSIYFFLIHTILSFSYTHHSIVFSFDPLLANNQLSVSHKQLWSLIFTPCSHPVPTPRFLFFNHIPISHTSQLATHSTQIFCMYCIQMPSQHSKTTCIHSNIISKFIPQHHHDRNTSAFS